MSQPHELHNRNQETLFQVPGRSSQFLREFFLHHKPILPLNIQYRDTDNPWEVLLQKKSADQSPPSKQSDLFDRPKLSNHYLQYSLPPESPRRSLQFDRKNPGCQYQLHPLLQILDRSPKNQLLNRITLLALIVLWNQMNFDLSIHFLHH